MQINSIHNYGISSNNRLNNKIVNKQNPNMQQVAFGNSEEDGTKGSNAMRNLIYGLMMLGAAAGTPVLTSCDDGHAEAWAKVEINMTPLDSLKQDCNCSPDTIEKWYYGFRRPFPLDTLFNNMKNWGIDGAQDLRCDPKANRNIIHYEGTREWEYGSKEIGDINLTESADPRVLIYDTEIQDYKGNHESYGKRILRIPTGVFYVQRKNGEELLSPKGCFVEEYENPFDRKGGSVLDCNLKSRAFVQTNGDTLNVARIGDSNVFVETGKVAKGYLGANSILLQNLIGIYDTDDHYVDFKVDAVNDEELRKKYVKDMDFQKTEGGNGNDCKD